MYFKWVSENQVKENRDICHLIKSKTKSSQIHEGYSIVRSG